MPEIDPSSVLGILYTGFRNAGKKHGDLNRAALKTAVVGDANGSGAAGIKEVLDHARPCYDYAELQAYVGDARTVHIQRTRHAGTFFRVDGSSEAARYGDVIVDALGRRWYRLRGPVVALRWFIDDTDSHHTAAFKRALEASRVVELDDGESYTIDADPVTRLSVGEGTGVWLKSQHSGARIFCAGRATIRPSSQRVEMFAQDGANDVTFEGIHFDNPFGVLQNMPKGTGGSLPNVGVAGRGNGANLAVGQFRGNNLTIRRSTFTAWNLATVYTGDADNKLVAVGNFTLEDVAFIGCAFGSLPRSPFDIHWTRVSNIGNVDSFNLDGSMDPGHAIYVTDRSAAQPEIINLTDCTDLDGANSGFKIRKGGSVSFLGITSFNSGNGGIEVFQVDRLVLGNINVKVKAGTTVANASGIKITDARSIESSNVVVDVRGADAWGLRVGAELAGPNDNKRFRLGGVTVVYDHAASPGKAPIIMGNVSDALIDAPRFLHLGTIAGSRHPIDLRGCTRVKVRHPEHIAPDAPSDANRLVSLDATCNACTIEAYTSGISVAWNTNTVLDSGTGTVYRIDGLLNRDRRVPTGLTVVDATGAITTTLEPAAINFNREGTSYLNALGTGASFHLRVTSEARFIVGGTELMRLHPTNTLIFQQGYRLQGNTTHAAGTGSPEGVVTAVRGSTWLRTDGGAGTTFYVKESGTGNTGWAAK